MECKIEPDYLIICRCKDLTFEEDPEVEDTIMRIRRSRGGGCDNEDKTDSKQLVLHCANDVPPPTWMQKTRQ
jgi:hypothetical protein